MNYSHNSISEIRTLLDQRGIALKKRFGQNFLVDPGVRRNLGDTIAREVASLPLEGQEVWEIGPGLGALTDELLRIGLEPVLRLFEIDHGVIAVLRERYGNGIPIEEGDFMHTYRRCSALPAAVVGNLPYHGAGAILPALVESPHAVATMVFLVQREMADRLRAQPRSKAYGAVSVLVQSLYDVEMAFSVSPQCFWPVPRVDSAVIILRRRTNDPPGPQEVAVISELARAAFSQRRKTLRTTLRDHHGALEQCGIDSGLRGEALSPQQYGALAQAVIRSRTA